MKKYSMITVLFCFILTAANISTFANQPSGEEKTINKDFNVQPSGKLNLELKTSASIEVEGWNKNVVNVNVTIKGRDAEDVEFNLSQSGNNVIVESKYKNGDGSHKVNIKVVVNIPSKYNVEYSTMGGSVNLSKAEGEFEGKTMGGEISLSFLKGKVEMKTMGGAINVKSCDLDGKIETMGGPIDVDDLVGNLNLSTMGGSIKQNNVRARNGAEGKEVVISTMGGEIEVDEAMNGAKVKTMGGSITVNKAALFVDAETMGGKIEIKEIDGKVKATTMGGDIEVKMTGDADKSDREVFLKSLGGDIHLTVPAKLSMDVDIEISYDKDRDDVKIISDFDLQQQRDVLKNNSKNNNLRYLIGTGAINGGKHKVKIKTIGGDVYLKKG